MGKKPKTIWVVWGRPPDRRFIRRERASYIPPDYSTDPRQYQIKGLENMSDAEYHELADILRAFINLDDAIDFAYSCNLVTVGGRGYRLVGNEYVEDSAVTEEFLGIDW